MMAQLALWRNDSGGGATVGGTANAITLTLSGTMQAYTQGILSFLATATNTGATTMKVDGTAAIPLRTASGSDMTGNEIQTGHVYFFVKNPSVAEWLVVGSGVAKSYVDAQVSAAISSAASSAAALYAPLTRNIATGTGLSGGGNLSADRTLALANTTVSAGSYTGASVTFDAQGRATAASSNPVIPAQSGKARYGLTTDGSNPAWTASVITAQAFISNGAAASPTINGAVNIASVSQSGGVYTFTFTTAYASTNYTLLVSGYYGANGANPICYISSQSTTGFTLQTGLNGSGFGAINGMNIAVIGGI